MTISRSLVLVTALLALPAPGLGGQPAAGPSGHWEGKIQIPEHEMPVTVDLAKNAGGAWIGSLSIPTSSSIDVPLSAIDVQGDAVKFTTNLPEKTSFDGKVSSDGGTLSGTVSNIDGSVAFQLARRGEASVKVPPPSTALPQAFEGTWEGTVDSQGKVRHVGLKLWAGADGIAMGTLIAIDQGKEIPLTTISARDGRLDLEARSISGAYHGTLANGEIAGEWTEGTVHLPLTFHRK
jgi:hypothetical protein